MSPKSLEAEALKLPLKARARLAEKLLQSLDSLTEEEVEKLWLAESLRRAEEIESGRVETIPSEEVFNQIRERLL